MADEVPQATGDAPAGPDDRSGDGETPPPPRLDPAVAEDLGRLDAAEAYLVDLDATLRRLDDGGEP